MSKIPDLGDDSYDWLEARVKAAMQAIRDGATRYEARVRAHGGMATVTIVQPPGMRRSVRVYAEDRVTIERLVREMNKAGHTVLYGSQAWTVRITPHP